MKKTAFVSAICGTLFAAAAVAAPSVRIQSVSVAPDVPHIVTVKYSLSEDAIVTASFLTNGVALADGAVDTVIGDVNRKIAATGEGETRTLKWTPDASFEAQTLDASKVTAKLTAWTDDSPPDYLVVDLRVASNVCYYASEDALPGKVTDRVYKDDLLVMRRIHAKDVHWVMGMSSNYLSKVAVGGYWRSGYSDGLVHPVRLTHDYYIGVYPMTTAQYNLIASGAAGGDRLPKTWVSYNNLRGTGDGAKWPQTDADGAFDPASSHAVDSTSWIAKFRNHTGLVWADLPTEAQWEFAERAGEKGLLPGGEDFTEANLSRYARYKGNQKTPDCEGLTNSLATVGSYRPNKWGLYDVLGNVMIWCLDYHVSWDDPSTDVETEQVDPVGPATGSNRQIRGSWDDAVLYKSFLGARMYAYEPKTSNGLVGFRLAMTLYEK